MKKYKVMAVMTSYMYLTVEAKNKEEAYDIADDTDGGEFVEESPYDGGWRIPMESIEEIVEGEDK